MLWCRTFNPSYLDVQDLSDGCGSKLNLVVVSDQFEGVSLIDRQRKVNDALSSLMPSIHALTMKTWTPEQYEKKKHTLE